MSAVTLSRETYLPEDGPAAARVHDFLAAHEALGDPSPHYLLAGPGVDDRVELPAEMYQVLRKVAEAMRQNLAVTVVPQTLTLTTQQAADILGVSRPTVIAVLDAGEVPFERIGTHRRILLKDLLAHRERRRAEQYAALAVTAVDIDDEEDPAEVLRRLRAARRAVAAERRRGPGD